MAAVYLKFLMVLVFFYISVFKRRVMMVWLGRHDHIGQGDGDRDRQLMEKFKPKTTEFVYQM